MPLPKNLKIRVSDRELEYGGKGGVTKTQALRAYSTGYMEGVNKKKRTTYKDVQTVKFVSGGCSINRRIKR